MNISVEGFIMGIISYLFSKKPKKKYFRCGNCKETFGTKWQEGFLYMCPNCNKRYYSIKKQLFDMDITEGLISSISKESCPNCSNELSFHLWGPKFDFPAWYCTECYYQQIDVNITRFMEKYPYAKYNTINGDASFREKKDLSSSPEIVEILEEFKKSAECKPNTNQVQMYATETRTAVNTYAKKIPINKFLAMYMKHLLSRKINSLI